MERISNPQKAPSTVCFFISSPDEKIECFFVLDCKSFVQFTDKLSKEQIVVLKQLIDNQYITNVRLYDNYEVILQFVRSNVKSYTCSVDEAFSYFNYLTSNPPAKFGGSKYNTPTHLSKYVLAKNNDTDIASLDDDDDDVFTSKQLVVNNVVSSVSKKLSEYGQSSDRDSDVVEEVVKPKSSYSSSSPRSSYSSDDDSSSSSSYSSSSKRSSYSSYQSDDSSSSYSSSYSSSDDSSSSSSYDYD